MRTANVNSSQSRLTLVDCVLPTLTYTLVLRMGTPLVAIATARILNLSPPRCRQAAGGK